ncbi:E3 ubiquitin-protein ligase RNF8 [Mytilus galloprovincialis]|uniref:E3 ubiquitin-protein ligase CHFR n=1 Tax=Mytilus galloprovincialis TaxID=29158 RepID=A0A8B6F1M8_MYTGA|nr:E3 ubiquitin-protein ligase RNF8 [Mytilus galloprovincialis]
MSQQLSQTKEQETTYIPCLHRIGDNIKKHKLISLEKKTEVTVGRAPDVTVCLLSNMISRCHAIFKCNDEGQWTVRDNKSLNGVFVNKKKLEPMCLQKLVDGDTVQFGVTKNSEEPPEFLYRFHTNLKIKRARPKSLDEVDCATPKRQKPMPVACQGPSNQKNPEWSPYQEYKDKLKQQEEEMARKMKEYEQKLSEMNSVLKDKEETQAAMKNELEEEKKRREENMKKMEETMKKKQEEMEDELRRKEEAEQQMKEELENRLLEKEATLLEQLQAQKEGLIEEKEKVEQSLRVAMEKALEEKNKTLEEELIKQKEKLETVILKKETEQKMLEAQLNEVKEEKDKQTEAVLHAKQDILTNFADLMETELQCSICNELFVQATSLNCSHSFCALCIQQWMKIKKECAVCRAPVTTTMRAISLDNYIDTMVSHLSDELKERRKQLVESRKGEQQKFNEENKPKPQVPAARGRGRGGRRGRGARGGRGGGANNPIVVPAANPLTNAAGHHPIIVEDDLEIDGVEITIGDDDVEESSNPYADSDESMEISNSSDDSDYVRGDEDAYYGGYGTCYRCGSRGHWANGCPFG